MRPAGPGPQYCVTLANALENRPVNPTRCPQVRARPAPFYPTSLLRIQQKSSGPLTRSGSRAPRTSLRFLPLRRLEQALQGQDAPFQDGDLQAVLPRHLHLRELHLRPRQLRAPPAPEAAQLQDGALQGLRREGLVQEGPQVQLHPRGRAAARAAGAARGAAAGGISAAAARVARTLARSAPLARSAHGL